MFTVWQISWWITSQPYTSHTTNQTFIPVDVKLSVVGQVIVDDQRHLRNVQTSSPNVSGDQHTALKHTNTHRLSTSPFRYLNQIQKLLTKNKSHGLKWPCDLGNKRVCLLPGPWSELLHDGFSLLLRHVTVHGWNCEVSFPHLLCQPVHLTPPQTS